MEVMAALNDVDVPCGPILSMKDIYEDQSLYDREMLVHLDHPTRGRYVQVGMPINLSDSPVEHKRSPLLGEHTDEVLAWLGYGEADIAAMKQEGAV
jgi:formyl-CoA transferase